VVFVFASRMNLAFFPENSQNSIMFELVENAELCGYKD